MSEWITTKIETLTKYPYRNDTDPLYIKLIKQY